ncbi:MAG TPA: hypothetical protein VE077_18140 [Candidatus Methylomirabilis sp.]|nr:hypothetical protein [Candidatus Methylomirabilis sp.]
MSFGPEPDWVRDALRLPFKAEHPRPGEAPIEDSPLTLTSFGDREFFQIVYSDGSRFLVDGAANRLWGTCPTPLTDEDLATYLLGPVMGFVLRRRGTIALHASSVCLYGKAVVLSGSTESGKSTTAAALALRAVPVLAEDISPIREIDEVFYIEPGYPRICLWPSAVEALLGRPDALPLLTPTWQKRFLPLDGAPANFEPKQQPLGAIYLLAPRTREARGPRIEELGKREALLHLVQNTYMNWLLDRTQRGTELEVLAKLVERVPVRKLVPHSDPAFIGALCDLILSDTEQLLERHSFAGSSGR